MKSCHYVLAEIGHHVMKRDVKPDWYVLILSSVILLMIS